MLTVTLQFTKPEEAIVALSKLLAGPAVKGATPALVVAPAAGAPSAPADAGTTPQVPATSKGRKPRADAGQARGPNARTAQSNAAAGVEVPLSGPAPATATEPPAAAPETAAPSPAPVEADKAQPPGVVPDSGAAAPTIEACQAALTKVFEAKGLTVSTDLMARFGVKRIKEMLPASYAEFIAKCEAVLNGEEV